jgi:chorismate dehydratase
MQQADAALIIGDPAMTVSREQFRVFDLATLWHEFTGFGFVFAMWMVRNDAVEKIRSIDFAGARDEGLANLDQVIASYPHQIPFSEDEMRQYLNENIVFKVDEEMRKGLERYFELAQKHKLIESAKQLALVG